MKTGFTIVLILWMIIGISFIRKSVKDKIKLDIWYVIFCMLLWPCPVVMAMRTGWKKGVERKKLLEAMRKR